MGQARSENADDAASISSTLPAMMLIMRAWMADYQLKHVYPTKITRLHQIISSF
jgi:hypothetical protein